MKENGFINEFKKFIMRGNVMDKLPPKHEEKEAAATAEK